MSAFDAVDEWYRERMRHVRVEHPSAESLRRATNRERARVGRAVLREEQGELRAFCLVSTGEDRRLRMRARPRGTFIQVERPCYFRPGAWRSAGRLPVTDFARQAEQKWGRWGLTRTRAESVLVERDRWLDEGAPRRTRLPVL